ncbi:MAG: hypothetical protein AAFV62_02985 [Pseudomonadota bacterium]
MGNAKGQFRARQRRARREGPPPPHNIGLTFVALAALVMALYWLTAPAHATPLKAADNAAEQSFAERYTRAGQAPRLLDTTRFINASASGSYSAHPAPSLPVLRRRVPTRFITLQPGPCDQPVSEVALADGTVPWVRHAPTLAIATVPATGASLAATSTASDPTRRTQPDRFGADPCWGATGRGIVPPVMVAGEPSADAPAPEETTPEDPNLAAPPPSPDVVDALDPGDEIPISEPTETPIAEPVDMTPSLSLPLSPALSVPILIPTVFPTTRPSGTPVIEVVTLTEPSGAPTEGGTDGNGTSGGTPTDGTLPDGVDGAAPLPGSLALALAGLGLIVGFRYAQTGSARQRYNLSPS